MVIPRHKVKFKESGAVLRIIIISGQIIMIYQVFSNTFLLRNIAIIMIYTLT